MKKICKILAFIAILILGNLVAFKMACSIGKSVPALRLEVSHSAQQTFQVFYSTTENGFTETKSLMAPYDPAAMDSLVIEVPLDTQYQYFRLDIGDAPAEVVIRSAVVTCGKEEVSLSLEEILRGRNFEPTDYTLTDGELALSYEHTDPYFLFQVSPEIYKAFNESAIKDRLPIILIACAAVTAIMLIALIKRDRLYDLTGNMLENRKLVWNLAKNDFKTKYAGSALGIVWAFVQPLVTILVYWMVFQFGLRSSSPVEGIPFVVWLIAGMIPWMFFNEALMNATACFIEYSYLVKKVVFKISIL